MTPEQRTNLTRLLKPQHIAFVGGTDAEIAIGEARRIGYTGNLWPVNRQREQMAGLTCFASVDDLPQAPDAVFLAIPSAAAIEAVEKLRDLGAGGVVCYCAGFSESGEQGAVAEKALIQAAGNMALIGPNCYGLINYLDRVALWPFAHGGESPGSGCAIVTQSGMLSSDLTMSQRSVPLTHMISIGNQAVLSIEDLIDMLSGDERVNAIGLHIEGLKNIGQFSRAAIKAAQSGKPIVALKTGSSSIGQALTTSHTGSLSGEDSLYDALFERCGVIRVNSPAQLLETLKFVCVAGIPNGDRLVGFTCSGGGATMLADNAEPRGLDFPQYSAATAESLRVLLPSIATVSNPLDYTTPIWGQPEKTKPVFAQALADAPDATLLVQDYPAAGLDESRHFYLADAQAFAEVACRANVPAAVCSTLPENLDQRTRVELIAAGIAPMQGIVECMEAVAGACRWRAKSNQLNVQKPDDLWVASPADTLLALDEHKAKKWLHDAGFDIPPGLDCQGGDLAKSAAQLGFPVALKMLHRKILHKTELGAVHLNLTSAEQVEQAAADMTRNVRALQPEALSNRFLLEAMQPEPLAELMCSVRGDPQFGYVLTLGSGGAFVELVADVASLLLPASKSEMLALVKKLKVCRVLEGYRGSPSADLDQIVSFLDSIAGWVYDNRDTVIEIELNPVFVYQDRLCVVDALLHTTADHS